MAANFSVKQKLSFWDTTLQSVSKTNVMCSCPSEEHMTQLSDAKGLIDSLVLNCMFELISTLRPCYMTEPQSLLYW